MRDSGDRELKAAHRLFSPVLLATNFCDVLSKFEEKLGLTRARAAEAERERLAPGPPRRIPLQPTREAPPLGR